MKKLISQVVLVVVVLILITGCTAPVPATTVVQETAVPVIEAGKVVDVTEAKVGFAQDTLNQPWRSNQAKNVKDEFSKNGLDAVITDGQGKAEQQVANIEDMLVQGLDLLVVSPAQAGALTPVVKEVYEKGIPVVCVDRCIDSTDYTTFVHADNYAIAALVADYIAEKMTAKYGSAKGNIVVLEGVPGSTTSVQRSEGFLNRIKEKYPELVILASQPANYRRDTAMAVMEDFLQAYDNIDVVFTFADESTMGAITAIENADRRAEILITSVNGTTEGIKAIIDGRMDCSVLYTNASGPGVELAMKILRGESVPKNIVINPVMINEKNAKDFFVDGTYSPDPMPLVEGTYIEN